MSAEFVAKILPDGRVAQPAQPTQPRRRPLSSRAADTAIPNPTAADEPPPGRLGFLDDVRAVHASWRDSRPTAARDDANDALNYQIQARHEGAARIEAARQRAFASWIAPDVNAHEVPPEGRGTIDFITAVLNDLVRDQRPCRLVYRHGSGFSETYFIQPSGSGETPQQVANRVHRAVRDLVTLVDEAVAAQATRPRAVFNAERFRV